MLCADVLGRVASDSESDEKGYECKGLKFILAEVDYIALKIPSHQC